MHNHRDALCQVITSLESLSHYLGVYIVHAIKTAPHVSSHRAVRPVSIVVTNILVVSIRNAVDVLPVILLGILLLLLLQTPASC